MKLREYLNRQGRGAATKLAREIGASVNDVVQWSLERRSVPIRWAVPIERGTGHEVTRRDLRPNDWAQIWPELAATEGAIA